jgi:energy-coupling factor transporter ATP-binding protein EcfA2
MDQTKLNLNAIREDEWMPIEDGETLTTTLAVDDITAAVIKPFDLHWDGSVSFNSLAMPDELPKDFSLGVIVGASGSGKSTLLKQFGNPVAPNWSNDKAIAAHFENGDAAERFSAVGLNSVPTWTKPYSVLSLGERFRADLARSLQDDAVIDEFTSVVDRNVAISASKAMRKHIEAKGIKRVVIASCHRDVLPWLAPDWVIDTDTRSWALRPRECLQHPAINIEVYSATREAWRLFSPHHYLTAELSKSAQKFIAVWNGNIVGFTSSLSFPHAHLKHAYRGTRTVILPDFQGLGIGVRLSDWLAAWHITQGHRYYSRTTHPRLGEYRNRSPLWRATSSSGKKQAALGANSAFKSKTGTASWQPDLNRIAYSHEYIGPALEADEAMTLSPEWREKREEFATEDIVEQLTLL